jgi:hypothetical protein
VLIALAIGTVTEERPPLLVKVDAMRGSSAQALDVDGPRRGACDRAPCSTGETP